MRDKLIKILGLEADATDEQIVAALESRPTLSKVAEALDLKADATEDEVLTAVKAAKEENDGTEVSLEERAKAEGKRVISNSDFEELSRNAAAGAEAKKELHQAKFDRAFDKALDEVRVDAKDETKARWQKLYDADADTTLEALEALPALANTKSRGNGGTNAEQHDLDTEEGRADLDTRVRARMDEKGEDYRTALDAVITAEERDAR